MRIFFYHFSVYFVKTFLFIWHNWHQMIWKIHWSTFTILLMCRLYMLNTCDLKLKIMNKFCGRLIFFSEVHTQLTTSLTTTNSIIFCETDKQNKTQWQPKRGREREREKKLNLNEIIKKSTRVKIERESKGDNFPSHSRVDLRSLANSHEQTKHPAFAPIHCQLAIASSDIVRLGR